MIPILVIMWDPLPAAQRPLHLVGFKHSDLMWEKTHDHSKAIADAWSKPKPFSNS